MRLISVQSLPRRQSRGHRARSCLSRALSFIAGQCATEMGMPGDAQTSRLRQRKSNSKQKSSDLENERDRLERLYREKIERDQQALEEEDREREEQLSLLLEGPSVICDQSPPITPVTAPNAIQNANGPSAPPILSSSSATAAETRVQIETSPPEQPSSNIQNTVSLS